MKEKAVDSSVKEADSAGSYWKKEENLKRKKGVEERIPKPIIRGERRKNFSLEPRCDPPQSLPAPVFLPSKLLAPLSQLAPKDQNIQSVPSGFVIQGL